MIGSSEPKPSQMMNSATRIGRIGDQVRIQPEPGARSRWATDMGARSYGRRRSDAILVSSPGAPVLPDATPAPCRPLGVSARFSVMTGRLALHARGAFMPGDAASLDALPYQPPAAAPVQ